MGIQPTGNRTFDAAAQRAQQIWQAAQAGKPTQAQARAADLAWVNAIIAAANASGGAGVASLFTPAAGGAPSAAPPGYNPNQLSSLY
jgi:hypothetical protein